MTVKVLSALLLAIFGLVAAGHAVMAYQRLVERKPGRSSVPLLNGAVGALGFWLFPDPEASRLWWLALVLDWGCLPLAVEKVVWRLSGRGGTKLRDQELDDA